MYSVVVEKCNCCNSDFPGFFLQFIDRFGNSLAIFLGVFADFKAMNTFKCSNLVCVFICVLLVWLIGDDYKGTML